MKTAVAYYSLGGTTRSYARAEAKARNADLIELTPKTPYNRFTAFVRGCLEAVKQKAVALDGMPQVIYALSDFLIMILSWLVKQSLRAFLFQEVQP